MNAPLTGLESDVFFWVCVAWTTAVCSWILSLRVRTFVEFVVWKIGRIL